MNRLNRPTPARTGRRRRGLTVLIGLTAAFSAAAWALSVPGAEAAGAGRAAPGSQGVPELSHIVVVFLENESATATFENPAYPALTNLVKQGSYVHDYYGAGHASLDNYLAIFSGEQPKASTEADCLGMAPDTCIYPASVPTLATTLDKAGLAWKAYSEGMVGAPGGHNCLHSPSLSVPDPYQGPGANGYATRHNPVPWFYSILDQGTNESYCQAHSVDLTQLWTDDQSPSTLPRWSFIEPDTCHDGHDDQTSSGGCAADPEGPTAPSGVAAVAAWLPGFVTRLTSSPAWDSRSVLVITFDEAAGTDTSGCASCHDTSAGGRVGALLIGPPVKTDFQSTWSGDHYGMLRTFEASLGLPTLKSLAVNPAAAALVHDGDPGVTPLTDVWRVSGPIPASAASAGTGSGSAADSSGTAGSSGTASTAAAAGARSANLAFTGSGPELAEAGAVLLVLGLGLAARRRRTRA